jgi:glutamyl-tRNA reductase
MARRAVSVSSAAVELAREKMGSLRGKTVLLVGAGKMAKICAKHLLNENGIGAVVMINRTDERVKQFAESKLPNADKFKIGFTFEDRAELAANADLVIVSTSAPQFVLTVEELKQYRVNNNREVHIVDIAAPRNVEPAVGELDGIKLFDTDHLTEIVDKNLAEREALVCEADEIVFDTLSEFHAWQRSLLVVPTITGLRRKIESIRDEQIRKTVKANVTEDGGNAQAEQISRAIVNQILHHPTVQLKATVDYQMLRRQAEALQTLFNLDVLAPEKDASPRRCPI